MNNFWIAIVISLFVSLFYVWWSVREQNMRHTDSAAIFGDKKRAFWLVAPLLLLLSSPMVYFHLGSYSKQVQLESARNLLSDMTSSQANIRERVLKNVDKLTLENLVLALRTASSQQPDNGELWAILAETYFQLRMTDQADAAISRAIRLEARPNWLVANAQILSLRSNDSDVEKSVRLLNKALEISPGHQSAMLTLGFIYLRTKQYQSAINIWQQLKSNLIQSGKNTDTLSKQIEFAQKQLNAPR